MDEWQARDEAAALCGRRLRRRRVAKLAGASLLAAGLLAVATSAGLAGPWSQVALTSGILAGTAGGWMVHHGRQFPRYADAYVALGLDPLTTREQLEFHRLLAHAADAPWAGHLSRHSIPRVRDLAALRQQAMPHRAGLAGALSTIGNRLMGLFDKLFGAKTPAPAAPPAPEHCLIVEFDYGSTDPTPVFLVGDQLVAALASARSGELDGDEITAGEFDGNEMAADGSSGSLYLYGADADRLLEVVRPVLLQHPFLHGAKLRLRYGPPGPDVRRRELTLSP